jgi:MYXO-CTERM domain-containing protein
LTPPTQHGIDDLGTVSIPTPQICWSTFTDRGGSGLDHYSLTIDGVLNRDNIKPGTTGTDCATPMAALAEGKHSWLVTAYDAAGNTTVATGSFVVDFSPPAPFAQVSPVGNANCATCGSNVVVVNTLTPTFVWQASSSSDSGLDHYEIYIDGKPTCALCDIPGTATSSILTEPLYPQQHYWEIYAFDRLGGSVKGYTPDGDRAWFTASCTGACLSPAERGPEPTPEPPRDAGVDAPDDSAQDSPVATATGSGTTTLTNTATGTASGTTVTGTATVTATYTRTATATTGGSTGTVTVTSTATTGTVTATSTAVSPEPQRDASPPITIADAANPDLATRADTAASRDGVVMDAMPGAVDTTIITPKLDAFGSMASDGGLVLADAAAGGTRDATVTGRDGGQTRALDGGGNDGVAMTNKASGGCGCVVGGGHADPVGFWPLLFLGFLVLWRGIRERHRPVNRD